MRNATPSYAVCCTRALLAYSLLPLMGLLAGCGNGGASQNLTGAGEITQALGAFTTRATGTLQPPVISASTGATVYGLAGASFTEIIQGVSDPSQNVYPASGKVALIRNNNLAIMNADGTNVRFLTSTYDPEGHPAWSPDGRKIAYEFQYGISIINADGTNPVRLLENGATPKWSPDGKRILFARSINLSPKIHVINADGTNLVQLTNTKDDDRTPSWSPDGTQIVFSRAGTIWVMNADGTGAKKIFDTLGACVYPVFQPNGKKILFYSLGDIFAMNPDGSAYSNITNSFNIVDGYPNFTSDGTSIYYAAGTAYLVSGIFRMTATGANQTNLTTDSKELNRDPDISPITGTVQPPTVTTKTLIGKNGVFGASCAGFLFGQRDKSVTSVVIFDTTTTTVAGRSAARVTPLTSTDTQAQNLIFSITGGDGTLKTLKYTNGDSPVITAMPGLTSSASGVIVTFSANDGSVTTVLPYTATKAYGSPVKVSRVNDSLQIEGTFLGAWDRTGRNMAPEGARQVSIERSTGRLLQVK